MALQSETRHDLEQQPFVTEKSENLKAWIVALRSGDYSQGLSDLAYLVSTAKDPNTGQEMPIDPEKRYCCLGVACELSGEGKWYEEDDEDRYRERFRSLASSEYFGSDTLEWLGFPRVSENRAQTVTIFVKITEPTDQGWVEELVGWRNLASRPHEWIENHMVDLAVLNDHKATFEDIARLIEIYDLKAARV
jgi:hypothetical protein